MALGAALARDAREDRELRLPEVIPGARRSTSRRAGPLSYYVEGHGPPLLLLHSINAAASAYEMKPIFERMRSRYRVYAPDLPGFGFSDRSERDYSVELYVHAVLDMLELVSEETAAPAASVVALSLTAEFAARATLLTPHPPSGLALIQPTGFDRRGPGLVGDAGTTREIAPLARFLELRALSRPLYQLLVRQRSIRYFLARTNGRPEVDPGLVEYAHLTSHQPGAEHAPLAFLSGRLFSADIRSVYERLALPVWVAHGTHGDFRDFSGVGGLHEHPRWRFLSFDTGAMPHFEQPDRFLEALQVFLAGLEPIRA